MTIMKVNFTETVLRDANQSLIATRLPFEKICTYSVRHEQGRVLLCRVLGRRYL